MSLPNLPADRHVLKDGADLSYYVMGPEDGRPLVLCHGLAASGLQFVEDAAFFAAQGFYVVVPDLRGHGRSTCGPQEADLFSAAHLADDVLTILDAENIVQTDWVGNSLGGILALEIMGQAPERLRKFASFGTAYSLEVPGFVASIASGSVRLLGTKLIGQMIAPMTCKAPEAQAIIYAMLQDVDLYAAEAAGRDVSTYDLIANAQSFMRPILMLRTDQDHNVNNALAPTLLSMSDQQNFTLIDIAGAGHCANLDQPDQIRDLLSQFFEADDCDAQ